MNTSPMQVILGVASLKAYVTAPKAFHVLGIVRFGQEYGLLATNTDGMYFRVNGSQVAELDTFSVERAIDHAQGRNRSHFHAPVAPTEVKVAPHIVIRKHRHAVSPTAH
jgi:hypothetical protein